MNWSGAARRWRCPDVIAGKLAVLNGALGGGHAVVPFDVSDAASVQVAVGKRWAGSGRASTARFSWPGSISR